MSTEVEHILKSLQDQCLHASSQNDAQLLLLALQLKTYAVAVYLFIYLSYAIFSPQTYK